MFYLISVADIAFRGYKIYDMDIKYVFTMKTITEQNPPLESVMAQEPEKSSIKHLESILQLERLFEKYYMKPIISKNLTPLPPFPTREWGFYPW
ncbi:MAG: hypothetical protein AN490_06170 [Anabaena sp. AL09]|nr:MAG: hypothetical protein AN490_06170 [Anabaena sp. AL09]